MYAAMLADQLLDDLSRVDKASDNSCM